MIRVFSYRPEFFNQNGDQGNLEALSYFTGKPIQHTDFESADFVLFGDASRAAMREFAEELKSFVPALQGRLDHGKPTLLVGSCFEFFAPMLSGMPEITRSERVSDFIRVNVAGMDVFGYRNTTVANPLVFVSGGFVGTVFFGPILAKNPELLEMVGKELGFVVKVDASERSWIQGIKQTIFD